MDLEVFDVDIGPQLGPPLGEITSGLQNLLAGELGFLDNVHCGHDVFNSGEPRSKSRAPGP
jgi:hypothetical protein